MPPRAIADWRTELALGEISDDDKASLRLNGWRIRELKSLALTGISDEYYLNKIQWPAYHNNNYDWSSLSGQSADVSTRLTRTLVLFLTLPVAAAPHR